MSSGQAGERPGEVRYGSDVRAALARASVAKRSRRAYSRPTKRKVFLPRSIPTVAIVVGAEVGDIGRAPLRCSTRKAYAIAGRSTAGPSH
jgi:hypothetical protein